MRPYVALIALLFVCLATFQFAQGQEGDDIAEGGYYSTGDHSGKYSDPANVPHGTMDTSTQRYIHKFLRAYCGNVAGEYRRCRNCVAVGCLRFMDSPELYEQYDECVEEHNRCCTKSGFSGKTAALASKCYATGFISEVGFGQLSVAKAIAGMQSAKAPRSFSGN